MAIGLTAILNICSTLTLVVALVFAALQVRAAQRTRAEQAALAIINTVQTETWAHTLNTLLKIPSGATAEQIDRMGPETERAIEHYGLRLETVGYMVFRGFISLETIDEMIGGVTCVMWSRLEPWIERDRQRTGSPRQYEWFQWLVACLQERRNDQAIPQQPAYVRYAHWTQSDARPAA